MWLGVWGGYSKSGSSGGKTTTQNETRLPAKDKFQLPLFCCGPDLRSKWAEPGSSSKVTCRLYFYGNETCFLHLSEPLCWFLPLPSKSLGPWSCSFSLTCYPGWLSSAGPCKTWFFHLLPFYFSFLPHHKLPTYLLKDLVSQELNEALRRVKT